MTMGTSIVGLPWCDTGAWRGVSRLWPARWAWVWLPIRERRQRRPAPAPRHAATPGGPGGRPAVDQLLDQAAPAQRAPDEAPAAIRLEVLQEAPVIRVALATLGDLGLD